MNKLKNNKLKLGLVNDKQKEAITSKSKRVLVLAGAGSGKTKVLTSRIAFLLAHGVREDSILSVTFTNKASAEMKERVLSLIDGQFDINKAALCMGTFHSVCNKLLREHYSKPGYDILDTADQKKLLKNVLIDAALLDIKVGTIKSLITFISKAKNSKLNPEESKSLEVEFSDIPNASHIYKLYEEYKESMNLLDFDDLIYKMVVLLEENPTLLNNLRSQFKHILVDEYQDTNTLQDYFLKLLLQPNNDNYLFVVGDDDQSIYGWRGAEVGNILKFEELYPSHHIIKLEENYRSSQNILSASNAVISNNKERYGKTLFTMADDGELLDVYSAQSPEDEALHYSNIIKHHHNSGVPYSDIAILYRANYVSRAFEAKLSESLIPYTLIGGVGFWSRLEIKDILAFLAVVNNSLNDIQTERNFSLLKGIGKKTIENLRSHARSEHMSVFDSIKSCIDKKIIKGKTLKTLEHYHSNMAKFIEKPLSPYNLVMNILETFNIFDFYNDKEGKEKGIEREENINEMVNFINNFNFNANNLDDFFEMVALQQDLISNKEDNDSVKLMTMHSAKGLEFPVVLIAAVENGVFPSERSLSSSKSLEEERRLMYVSMTRAMNNLYLSYAPYRFGGQYTGVSRFIGEIPEKLYQNSNFRNQNINRKKSVIKNNINEDTVHNYSSGDEIEDPTHGSGVIIAVNAVGKEIWLTVDFDFIGKKMIKKSS